MQTLPPPQPLSRSAARMARHRLRRKQGLRSLTIDIREAEIETLIQRGRLAPESRGDLAAIKRALHGFLDDALR